MYLVTVRIKRWFEKKKSNSPHEMVLLLHLSYFGGSGGGGEGEGEGKQKKRGIH